MTLGSKMKIKMIIKLKQKALSTLHTFTLLVILLTGKTAMASPQQNETIQPTFTTEQQLIARYKNEINTFWQQGIFQSFQGVDDIRINYGYFSQTEAELNQCIVIVNGRTESYLKYQELSFDLFQQGYSIFFLDHRGQGLSQRLVANSNKGYVESFDDYVDDLAYFIDNIVQKHCSEKPFMLSHSMGGAIAVRYLQKFQNTIKAAVFSSPMIAINSGGLPTSVATALVKTGEKLNQWFSDEKWYFLGQDDYQPTSFDDNALMHSKIRYQIFSDLYQQHPNIQLGGVTVKWLSEAIDTQEAVFNNIDKLKTPILLMQAGNDSIVDNDAQTEFCQKLHQVNAQSCPSGKPLVIDGAYHEVFFESDNMRSIALDNTLTWFEKFKNK